MKVLIQDIFAAVAVVGIVFSAIYVGLQINWSYEACEEIIVINNYIAFFGIVGITGVVIPIGFRLPHRIKTGSWD